MTNRFMISVAAVALIAATGFANAQGTGGTMGRESTETKSPESTTPSPGMKATQSEQKSPTAGKGAEDMQGQKAEGRNGRMNAETKGAAETKSQTTGQAGAGGKLSSEQRTKITTVIRGQRIAPVNNVNFAISIGTRVPREVSFHPLPTEVVTVYPEWRGYEFFLVRDQIIVVDPRTLEIVAVLEA